MYYPRRYTIMLYRLKFRSRVWLASLATLLLVLRYIAFDAPKTHNSSSLPAPTSDARYIEIEKSKEILKADEGVGCVIPELDPFSEEVTKFYKRASVIKCYGQDWVKCYHSTCRVVDAIKYDIKNITCTFRDILYHSDKKYTIGRPTRVGGHGMYELKESDHVKVACVGTRKVNGSKAEWWGNTLGLRPVAAAPAPPGRARAYNVVVFGFDSTSRLAFIRHMPKSWHLLRDIATIMEGYNVVGDGTPAALFPLLTGKTEIELPYVGKTNSNRTMDSFPFIFYKLKQDGYRTAFFDDMPQIGTFQYRLNGFRHQPADHYLRAFYLEDLKTRSAPVPWLKKNRSTFCLGDTPQFKVMINMTEQFLKLDGKRFIFTFIADISHGDYNLIQNADDDTAALLYSLLQRSDDTLIVVMGDHGPRYSDVRNTLQGKLEERLPLLAIRLPSRLTRARPHAQRALERNARALTTPHDLHATILDVLDMRQHWNPQTAYEGAHYTRALTMLEPIPVNRSCGEAGIEPHWCACLAWQNVSTVDPMYEKTARVLIVYINSLVAVAGGLCVPRTLESTPWVLRQRANRRVLAFRRTNRKRPDTNSSSENYQIKIVVGPGRGTFEASMTYLVKEDKFLISSRNISRTNAYGNEPECIRERLPHLAPYCYCRDHQPTSPRTATADDGPPSSAGHTLRAELRQPYTV